LVAGSLIVDRAAEFAADVRAGLSKQGRKELPSKYLYDAVGSALFEVITVLPEYGLTRADLRLLQRRASELVELLPGPALVTELGSGSGKKARVVVEELVRHQPVTFYPIDISPAALEQCQREFGQVDSVEVTAIEAGYLEGLQQVVKHRPDGMNLLVLFLGSTIGNFDRPQAQEFLREINSLLRPHDSLLLSTDLEKPLEQLLPAYNDAIGATAAFNLNLLTRINRELDGNFNLSQFDHVAPYNQQERRIEMLLRSTTEQSVRIGAADLELTFKAGESIWTESSYKFNPAEMRAMGKQAGFHCAAQWVDEEWPFAQTLYIAR